MLNKIELIKYTFIKVNIIALACATFFRTLLKSDVAFHVSEAFNVAVRKQSNEAIRDQ